MTEFLLTIFNYHFKNKEEVLLRSLESIVIDHEQQLSATLSKLDNDPVGMINEFIEFHLGTGAYSNPEILSCWIIISSEAI